MYKAAARGASAQPAADRVGGAAQHLQQRIPAEQQLLAAGCCAAAAAAGRAAAGQQEEAGSLPEALREHVVVGAGVPGRLGERQPAVAAAGMVRERGWPAAAGSGAAQQHGITAARRHPWLQAPASAWSPQTAQRQRGRGWAPRPPPPPPPCHPARGLARGPHLTAFVRHSASTDSVGASLGMSAPQREPCTSLLQERPSACRQPFYGGGRQQAGRWRGQQRSRSHFRGRHPPGGAAVRAAGRRLLHPHTSQQQAGQAGEHRGAQSKPLPEAAQTRAACQSSHLSHLWHRQMWHEQEARWGKGSWLQKCTCAAGAGQPRLRSYSLKPPW